MGLIASDAYMRGVAQGHERATLVFERMQAELIRDFERREADLVQRLRGDIADDGEIESEEEIEPEDDEIESEEKVIESEEDDASPDFDDMEEDDIEDDDDDSEYHDASEGDEDVEEDQVETSHHHATGGKTLPLPSFWAQENEDVDEDEVETSHHHATGGKTLPLPSSTVPSVHHATGGKSLPLPSFSTEENEDIEEAQVEPPQRRSSGRKTLPLPSFPAPSVLPTSSLTLVTPPTSSPAVVSRSASNTTKEKAVRWTVDESMAMGKHMKDIKDEDVDGITDTEQKWWEIADRMRNIDGFDKTWHGIKNKWNRWGRSHFGIDERVRRRTNSMTTGIRNKPAPKIKASKKTTTNKAERNERPSSPATSEYVPCYCGDDEDKTRPMIACDGAHPTSWFHYDCVGVVQDNLPENWYCRECVAAGFALHDEDADNEDDEDYQLPLVLPDDAPRPKRKRDHKDDFDDEYGPDAVKNTTTVQSTKRLRA